MNKNLIILSIGLIFFVSCKKWEHQYPEDIEKSKVVPISRLIEKWWVLQNVTVDGIDYTDSVKSKIGYLKVIFKNEKAAQSGTQYVLGAFASSGIEPEILAYWKLSDNEETIGLSRFGGYPSIQSYVVLYEIYHQSKKILRLEKSIFKIEYTDSNRIITNTFTAL